MKEPPNNFPGRKVTPEAVLIPANEVLRAYLSLTALSALVVALHIVAGVMVRRFGLHIPGLSGVVWMPLLVIGKIKWRTKISATYMAAIASVLVLWLTPMLGLGKVGGLWLFPFLRYGIPGIVLDALWPFVEKFSDKPRSRFVIGGVVTGLAHTGKAVFVMLMLTWNLGFGHYILNHFALGIIVLLHFGFGAVGGIIGALIGYSRASYRNLRNAT